MSCAAIILFAHAPYAKFLGSSLESITAQSYSSLKIIVLGDGSEAVAQTVAEFRQDHRVILRSQGNRPFLQAANDIMRETQADYFGTWNSDDIYNRDHVKVLVRALENDREAGAVFDNLEYFNETDGNCAEPILSGEQAKLLSQSRVSLQRIFDDNIMTGPSSLIRKAAVERVGGYDEDIYLNCDLHWFYRIGAYFPIRFVDYVGVRKRIHPLNNTAVNPHYEYGVRELENIRDKYPEVYKIIGKSVFDKKLGRKYFRLGKYYQRLGDRQRAREMYKQAMVLRKFSFRYHWEYLQSMRVS